MGRKIHVEKAIGEGDRAGLEGKKKGRVVNKTRHGRCP